MRDGSNGREGIGCGEEDTTNGFGVTRGRDEDGSSSCFSSSFSSVEETDTVDDVLVMEDLDLSDSFAPLVLFFIDRSKSDVSQMLSSSLESISVLRIRFFSFVS